MVQSDLFKPTQVTSYSNKRYFITFLDKFSKWLEVESLSFKNDAFKAFERYLIKEERNSSKKLKTLRTDNRTELLKIHDLCSKKGIKSEKTAPYAHKQAGAAERINLTLLNKIRALLFIAKLSIKFWAEALNAVVYLYNRTPHASLNYKYPYEMKYGKKPNLENIKIWGSIAYNRINNAKKLNKRAKSYILIDYNSNQYKLLDLITRRVVWSRDVIILEGIFPYKWKNTEDYDINNYVNLNNNYEIIIDNAITSHIPFKRAVDVDRAENQLTNQHSECDMSKDSENNTQNT